jgi:hypothetical protein
MKKNILIENIIKEILLETPDIVRYDKIKNNIMGVLKLFGGEIIKVKFKDRSTIIFDTKNNKLMQSSEGRSIKNFSVEVKRYIRVRHEGNILPFLEEFNYFEGYSKLEENKKNMAIKRVTLKELREIVLDIIKEEKQQLNVDFDVKKNKVLNILKSMGLSHDEAKKNGRFK